MNHFDLSITEQKRRKDIVKHIRFIMLNEMRVEAQDETTMMLRYQDYYLQVSFSELHPLMVFCLAKALPGPVTAGHYRKINELNLRSVLGSHAVNEEVGCYSYRATHWLDTEINVERFFEILDRCVDEAQRGYRMIA